MKSVPKVSKKALRSHHMRELRNYNHELILWTRERPVKKVFHFMTESNDRRLFWKNVFATSGPSASPSASTANAQPQHASSTPSPSSSQPGSRCPSRPSSRPSSAYGNGPVSLSDPSHVAAAVAPSSHGVSEPSQAPNGSLSASTTTVPGSSVTFSALPAGSNPFQPSAASAYMATRFSSLSEHMAFALKGVGEEEKKSEKRKEKQSGGKDAAEKEGAGAAATTPSASISSTPETRPRLSTLSRDASIFRTPGCLCPSVPCPRRLMTMTMAMCVCACVRVCVCRSRGVGSGVGMETKESK